MDFCFVYENVPLIACQIVIVKSVFKQALILRHNQFQKSHTS